MIELGFMATCFPFTPIILSPPGPTASLWRRPFRPPPLNGSPPLRRNHRPPASKNDGDQNIDVAVFRFTLGIPGFDDSNIPRLAGMASLALLLLNHALSSSTLALSSTELVGSLLSAIAIAAPNLERRLKELEPGRGRAPSNPNVVGGDNVFAIASNFPNDSATQELAWASYTLLKNSNICGVFVVWGDSVVLCRGILSAELTSHAATLGERDTLGRATKAWANALPALQSVLSNEVKHYEDRRELEATGAFFPALSPIVPEGTRSMALLPLPPPSLISSHLEKREEKVENFLVLVSDRERSLSPKEIAWAEGVAAALYFKLRICGNSQIVY